MKLRKGDKVLVISGRDKGKTGEVLSAVPAENKVIVAGVNVVKRHTKPNTAHPRGGIIELTKPVRASKVMAIDPSTGKPARIGYTFTKDGAKERVFKVSKQRAAIKDIKKAEKKAEKKSDKKDDKKAVAKKLPAAKKKEEK